MTAVRRSRLGQSSRIVAVCGSRAVGLAAYERSERELRVTELGVDQASPCAIEQVASGLLDALELACLAGGARRLVLLPRAAIDGTLLQRRGFASLSAGTGGTWFEKRFA